MMPRSPSYSSSHIMAGGLFDDQPFSLNLKCVAATLLIAGGYWYLPAKNIRVLIALLYFPYLALAWYDHFYQCKITMDPTVFPFGRFVYLPFKPPEYKKKFDELSPSKKQFMSGFDRFLIAVLFGVGVVYFAGK